MKFYPTELQGACIIDPDLFQDERGFFARTFCREEFQQHGLSPDMIQCNISFNKLKGTLRGMHFQLAPHGEGKLVRCTRGAIYDVIIDLRPTSKTHLKWIVVELTEENRKMLYIPEGFAHGFQTLQDNTEVFYQMTSTFVAQAARGIRWNDSSLNIQWPSVPTMISEKDQSYPDYQESLQTI